MAVKERTTIALDPEVKREATDVLERMGLSLSSFTEICLRQAVRDRGHAVHAESEAGPIRRVSGSSGSRRVSFRAFEEHGQYRAASGVGRSGG